MNLTIAAVGRLREPHFREAEAEYRKRLRRYCNLRITETKSDNALLHAISERAHLYALDEKGELLSSTEFAFGILEKEQQHGGGAPVVFAIGGPDGHANQLRQRAHKLIAFGRITLGHRIARIVLLEQLYRGYTILRGEPYHRG